MDVLSIASSMMADVADEYKLLTGENQEGMFFAALSFAYKCTVGLGAFIAGILLKVIALPKQTAIENIPPEAINGLGIIGVCLLGFYLTGLLFISRYPINKQRYLEIRNAIDSK